MRCMGTLLCCKRAPPRCMGALTSRMRTCMRRMNLSLRRMVPPVHGMGQATPFGNASMRCMDVSMQRANAPMHATGQAMTPKRLPTFVKAATARSTWAGSCAAESWTRMRASPFGTTG